MKNLQDRTKKFAIDIIRLCNSLPDRSDYKVISHQLLRSGTAVGANYRAACHCHSKAAFIAKLSIVEEEADESLFWLELIEELGCINSESTRLKDEADQLTAIFIASKKTAKSRR